MDVLLNINNLEYSYRDEITIFDNLCMNIVKSSLTAISGPNNSGKTTLLKLLSINKYNHKEKIVLNGKDIVDYSKEEYDREVQLVLFTNSFKEKIVEDELYIDQTIIDEDKTNYLINLFKVKSILNKEISKLDNKDKYKILLIKKILNTSNLLLIDSLDEYFTFEEVSIIIKSLKKCIEKYHLTIIITINNLINSLETDKLYIINEGRVILSGEPIKVLEKDNIINKAGLEIPFMIDLSVKLRDYNLIDKIILSKDKLINTLWK